MRCLIVTNVTDFTSVHRYLGLEFKIIDMKDLLILGAGTSGTMMANHLIKRLPKEEWKITIVDKEKQHYYQPGYLFIPFDIYKPKEVKKSIDKFIPKGANLIREGIELIDKDAKTVTLKDGRQKDYFLDVLQQRYPHLTAEYHMIYPGNQWGSAIGEYYQSISAPQ